MLIAELLAKSTAEASAVSAAIWIASVPGLRITTIPAKPRPIAAQRTADIFSPRNIPAIKARKIGVVPLSTVASAIGIQVRAK